MDWSKEYKRERAVTLDEVADTIRATVPMLHAIEFYYPELNPRHNRIPCPIHNGKDYNFAFGTDWYKCYVCGAAGDVISFVKESQCAPTRLDAIKRINNDFMLHLPLRGEVDTQFSETALNRRKEAQKRERIRQAWWDKYDTLMDEWAKYDKIKMSAEPMSDEWCNAVKRLEYIGYLLDGLPNEPR